jgi:SAM-dependent methyltransferase
MAKASFPYTWEQAIDVLRRDPQHQSLIFDAYLTSDLAGNAQRFFRSDEFREVLALVKRHAPNATRLLDMPGGNGIATAAFAKSGFEVTTVEPDPSPSVGRGAIATVLHNEGLTATLVEAYGESLPFADGSFDVAYVRQGLHHARDLPRMVAELSRVLAPGGVLLATREHVVDNYGKSLQDFLDSQVDHQLYGGEHAFTLPDYRAALSGAALEIVSEWGPYDSDINLHPNTPAVLADKIVATSAGRLLSLFLPRTVVVRIGMWRLRTMNAPGRLYTFLARKPAGS